MIRSLLRGLDRVIPDEQIFGLANRPSPLSYSGPAHVVGLLGKQKARKVALGAKKKALAQKMKRPGGRWEPDTAAYAPAGLLDDAQTKEDLLKAKKVSIGVGPQLNLIPSAEGLNDFAASARGLQKAMGFKAANLKDWRAYPARAQGLRPQDGTAPLPGDLGGRYARTMPTRKLVAPISGSPDPVARSVQGKSARKVRDSGSDHRTDQSHRRGLRGPDGDDLKVFYRPRYLGEPSARNSHRLFIPAQTVYGDIHLRNRDLSSSSQGSVKLSGLHKEIVELSRHFQPEPGTREWTNQSILTWGLQGDHALFRFKDQWVGGYRDAILAASEKFDLPPELVAGVMYIEVGGDPLWIDPIAYAVRDVEKRDRTSFGNASIQVRRAAESLGYGSSTRLTKEQRTALIGSLKDPTTSIFIAAKHLADLRDIDFKGISARDLNDEQLRVIATRYNRGSDLSIDEIRANTSHGEALMRRRDLMMELLGLTGGRAS